MIERNFNVTKYKSIIIGDFNIDMDTPTESDVIFFNDLLDSLNMENRIIFLTHKFQHTLDLIIEDRNEKLLYNLEKGLLFPDHNFIHSTLDVRKEAPPKKTLTYRSLKGIEVKDLFKDIIGALDDFEGDVKQLVDNYNNIRKYLDAHAPVKTKVVKTIQRHPWFNDKIRAEVIIQTTQRNYYHKLLEENKNDFKAIFSIANKLLFRNDSLPLPPTTSVQKLANGFIDFFTEKMYKIMVNLIPTHPNQTDAKYSEKSLLTDRQFNTFRMVTEKDVKVPITNVPPRHCELDSIQTTLLRQMIDVVASIITKIVNTSLQSGIFLINLKEGLLWPLLKKLALELIFKNFRPVSNLSYLSKLIEHLVCEQIVAHTEKTGDLEDLLSAYIANHSTEMALLRVKTDIMQAIDDQELVCLVLLDLSVAFDTKSHDLLLNHLYHCIGIGETVLQWVRSYLSDRTHRVVIDVNEDTTPRSI